MSEHYSRARVVDTDRESLGLTEDGSVLWHGQRFVVQAYVSRDPWARWPRFGATLLGEGETEDAAVLDAIYRGNAQHVAHMVEDVRLHKALAGGAA